MGCKVQEVAEANISYGSFALPLRTLLSKPDLHGLSLRTLQPEAPVLRFALQLKLRSSSTSS
jgi:hypothetical protein